ncbi:MAG TPA: methylamine utilization protein MauJ [Thermoanaerobaculia bacterium]|nr:methylamine utilization protein MauJ [Thermoanaerobaculia bacterium]
MPSIFMRHPQSGPLEVQPDIRERLDEALNHLASGGRIEDLIRITSTPSWRGIEASSTWAQLLKETCDKLRVPEHGGSERVAILFSVLQAALAAEPGPPTWEAAKHALLNSVDIISGWEHSSSRQWHRAEPVWREGGHYFTQLFGEVHEIIGRRTEQEERWDFVADSAEHAYKPLHLVLRIIALICIADLYKRSPARFPASIEVSFYEQTNWTTFTAWRWQQRFPFFYRRTKWRPPDVLCDPEWFASDIVASFADREGIQEEEPPALLPPDLETQWRQVFGHFAGQFEFAVECEVRFGEAPERWFEFRGRTLRWINRTDQEESILIVPVENRSNADHEHTLALRFLSVLAFATGQAITTRFALIAGSHFLPSIRQSRRLGATLYRDDFDPFIYGGDSNSLDLPLALYREGVSSGSVYYSFLSFYKVVQLAFHERRANVRAWIEENKQRIGEDVARLCQEEDIPEGGLEGHLYESCRCAIAHVSREPVVDPDDSFDWRRISLSVPVVRDLARLAITSGLFGQSRWAAH